jgi:hypothetical protein
MPRIVVECRSNAGWLGQGIDLLVDGRERAKIGRDGARAEADIEAGVHVLQARVGRVMSLPLNFRILERETIGFDCVVAGAWRKRVTLAQSYRRASDERFKPRDRGLLNDGPATDSAAV